MPLVLEWNSLECLTLSQIYLSITVAGGIVQAAAVRTTTCSVGPAKRRCDVLEGRGIDVRAMPPCHSWKVEVGAK